MADDPGPAAAIACYERLHGLLVTVHDLDGRLRSQVGPERLSHRHPRCIAAKADGSARCVAADVDRLPAEVPWDAAGILRRCPFGVREAVVVSRRDGRIAWTLFAGPLTGDGADALEGLRQLAARLRLWEDAHAALPAGRRVERGGSGDLAGRRATILRWIELHHRDGAGLDDLAAALGLSRSQASRAVSAACGRGLRDLLTAARIGTARALLTGTDLPVADIAVRSGFGDRSHFHRAFRSVTGMTPDAARRAGVVAP